MIRSRVSRVTRVSRCVGATRLFAIAALAFAACSDNGAVTLGGPGDASIFVEGGGIPPGGAVGQSCDDGHPCRVGLACDASKCAPSHSLGDGSPCTISAECKPGDYCGSARTCAGAGKGHDGDGCKSDADCASGLRCDLVGFGLQCKPEGIADVGGACVTSADCFGGLVCATKTCAPAPPGASGLPPIGVPTWNGEACQDDPGATQAYFRVPRGSGDGDFYRLPFPNDVRLKAGHPDLSGHPTPGPELLGYDVVDRYLRDVEKNTDGFSTYPTVLFRFSAGIDFESLKTQSAIRMVDVTPGAGGGDLGFSWSATTGRSAYLCPNSFALRPPTGVPLAR